MTPIPDGYMVGRILDRPGKGPWWEYIHAEPDFFSARAHARELAVQHGVRAWVFDSATEYREITSDYRLPNGG